MDLIPELNNRNIVLNTNCNLSDFDRFFFIKNEIIKEANLKITPKPNNQIDVFSDDIKIVINKNKIILSPNKKTNNQDFISLVKKFINSLTNFECKSFGINFEWIIKTSQEKNIEYTRKLFTNNHSLYTKVFNTPNSVFGTYASCDYKNSRLKLDIKPVKGVSISTQEEFYGINCPFNFHFVVSEANVIEYLNKTINEYEEYFNYSHETAKSIGKL